MSQFSKKLAMPDPQSAGRKELSSKNRLLKLPAVLERVQISKSEWYRRVRKGTVPSSVSLGARAVAWLESDIDIFIESLKK